MKKVLIIGCPGGGKSSFARKLQKCTSLPLYHLDMLFWNADKTTVSREILCERVSEVLKGDEWIIDGNYSATLPMRLEACDTVFFLDMSPELCLRGVEQRRGQARPDMPWIEEEEDPEFTDYIKHFNETARPRLLELLENHKDKALTVFHSHAEIDAYLSRLDIRSELMAMKEEQYRLFSASLTPTKDPEQIIGVRVPLLRKYAKQLARDGRAEHFLLECRHEYLEEEHLHAFLIEQIKDFESCLYELERFLPHIDNWASCDSLRPKALTKDKELLLRKIKVWLASPHEYTVRFAIECLMLYYLDGAFTPEIHKLVAGVDREEYYIRMMVAWYFATSLAKRWEDTIEYITTERLEPWVHAKTIQKACESYRLTNDQKQYLRRYK
jgi:adenylate kinase family enzyme